MNKASSKISKIGWRFDNTYSKLPSSMMSRLAPVPVKKPELVILNHSLSEELGLDFSNTKEENLALIFAGNLLPEGSETIAQAYAGHQFGHFTMLGDGRAIVIGEHLSKNNERFEFLGDSVLDLIVSNYMIFEYENLAEGSLSKIRAAVVNESCLISCVFRKQFIPRAFCQPILFSSSWYAYDFY